MSNAGDGAFPKGITAACINTSQAMKKSIFSAIILLFMASLLFGQVPMKAKFTTLQLQFGANQLKEENLMPKVHGGTKTNFVAGYELRRDNYSDYLFSLGWSRVKTGYEDLSATANWDISFAWSYGFSVADNDHFQYWLGPVADLSYDFAFYPMWDDSHLYWANYISIGAKNIASLQFGDDKELFATLSLPLASVFSRPDARRLEKAEDLDLGEIMEKANSDWKAGTWNRAIPLRFTAEYRFPAFRNKMEAFTYSFSYIRLKGDNSDPYQRLSHQFGLKFFL
jgi:hypothetical protein